MSEMVERVARAIATADEQNGALPYEARIAMGKHVRAALFDQARAAIEAMREPTEAMVGSGGKSADWDHRSTTDEEFEASQRNGATTVWQAMIDAALK